MPRLMARLPTKRRVPGQMSKLEQEWEQELTLDEHIFHFEYESVRLVIGDKCSYTPDFFCLLHDGSVVMYEVKGYWLSTGRVKIKAAARKFFMFKFIAVSKRTKKDGGGWKIEEIKP